MMEVANTECLTVPPDANLGEAFQRMQKSNCSTVPVVHGTQLVGLLTFENIGELVMVSSAMDAQSKTNTARSSPDASAP